MFHVWFSRKADKQHRQLDEKMQNRVADLLVTLQTTPVPTHEYDIEKISGSDTSYRVRLGQYRVLYTIYWDEKSIEVTKIDRKSDRTYK